MGVMLNRTFKLSEEVSSGDIVCLYCILCDYLSIYLSLSLSFTSLFLSSSYPPFPSPSEHHRNPRQCPRRRSACYSHQLYGCHAHNVRRALRHRHRRDDGSILLPDFFYSFFLLYISLSSIYLSTVYIPLLFSSLLCIGIWCYSDLQPEWWNVRRRLRPRHPAITQTWFVLPLSSLHPHTHTLLLYFSLFLLLSHLFLW